MYINGWFFFFVNIEIIYWGGNWILRGAIVVKFRKFIKLEFNWWNMSCPTWMDIFDNTRMK